MSKLKNENSTVLKKKVAFALIMGVITTGLISFLLVAVNVGFNARFIIIWLKSWLLAYIFVIPAILFVAPKIEKLVDRLFLQNSPNP